MIIAISGKKQSGKSTLANIIQYYTAKEPYRVSLEEYLAANWLHNSHNNKWKIKSFAEKLKEIVSLLTGIPAKDMDKEEIKQRELPDWKVWRVSFEAEHNDFEHTINRWFLTEDEARDFIDDSYLVGFELKEVIPTVRFLLQRVGTDLFRNQLNPDVWVNSLFSEYNYSHILGIIEPPITGEKSIVYPHWLICDMRFPNELRAVQQRNGLCVRINRPGIKEDNHISETSLDDVRGWRWVFDNSKDIDYLTDQVKEFIKYYKI